MSLGYAALLLISQKRIARTQSKLIARTQEYFVGKIHVASKGCNCSSAREHLMGWGPITFLIDLSVRNATLDLKSAPMLPDNFVEPTIGAQSDRAIFI
jgi:hypothetical protein